MKTAAPEPQHEAPAGRLPRRPSSGDTAFASPGSDAASGRNLLLSLQRSAGNAAVARSLAAIGPSPQRVSRRPAATAPKKKPRKPAGPNSYVDLMNGIQDLVDAAEQQHGAGLAAVKFGTRLGDEHREWLESLRHALVISYSGKPGTAQEGLETWESLQPRIWTAMEHAHHLGVPSSDVAHVRETMSSLHEKTLRPAAYWDAHRETVAHGDLKAPDLVFQQKKLEEAESEFEAAEQLLEEAGKLAGQGVTAAALGDAGLGKDIVELVRLPGSIEAKLDWAKKNGMLAKTATGAELVNKVAGATKTVAVVACEVGHRYAEAQHALAATKGAIQMAERWEKIVVKWAGKLEWLEKAGRVIGVIGVVADALKMVRAIARGDWAEAANEGGAMVVDIAALGAAEGAPLLGAISVVIKAEIAALQLAAQFAHWCKEENVREAASHFIDACDVVAKNAAFDFVADADLLLNPANANISDIVGKQLVGHTAAMRKAIAYLGSQLDQRGPTRLGGQPVLVAALGTKAQKALTDDIGMPDDPLTTAERVRDVFAGANSMAQFVRSNYPQGEPEHEGGGGHEKKEGEGAKEHAHAE